MTTGPLTADLLADQTATPLPWEEGRRRLSDERFYWLATVHADGRPHVRPVLGVWVDGALHTTSSPSARKGQNLAADPRCSFSVSTDDMDVVLEGEAVRLTETPGLQRVADAYVAKYGWPATVAGSAFDAPYGAPTAGPPPYEVWRVVPSVVFGFGTDDALAPRTTRWRF